MGKKVKNRQTRRPRLEEIEPRILYSADFAPGLVPDTTLVPDAEQRTVDSGGEFAATAQEAQARRHELVLVETDTPDYQKLVDDILKQAGDGRDIEVVLLDAGKDGLQQITDILAARQDLSAVHLVSHGADGTVELGATELNFDALLKNATQIKGWGKSLSADADILIYGCDVAQSDGKALIDALARLTGADVAASEDLTGAAAQGGNWTLEYRTGGIDTPLAISTAEQFSYSGTLATYTVTNTNDTGAGSLRQAIQNANANGGADTIAFNIAGAGVKTINVMSALPAITGTVVIDGTTQPGFASTPLIEIDGQTQSYEGLYLDTGSDGSTIKGLAINHFMRAILINTSSNNVVVGNFLGTDATGTVAKPNWAGVATRTSNNIIGGTSAVDRNIISGNSVDGIQITGASGGSGNVVMGNYIGLDVTGTVDLGNTNQGVALYNGAKDNIIGGTAAGAGNVISGNNGEGVRVVTSGTTGNVVVGNLIGTNAAGTAGIANNRGVWIDDTAADNTVGGTAAGAGNVIAYNTLDGVTLSSTAGTGNSILHNTIFSNGGLGIDLSDDGVTANDGGDGDTGPNGLQNFPVLTSATTNASGTQFVGSLNSNAGTYRIEFFANRPALADGTGFGEGERYLAYTTVTIPGPGPGTANFNLTLPVWVNNGERITATATVDLGGGNYGSTSEFAQLVTAVSGVMVVDTADDVLDGTITSVTNLAANRGVDGRISLREAITATNNTGGSDVIAFAIPGSGPYSISISTALPQITDAVVIDGTTQTGFAGAPIIELNGTGTTGTTVGLRITSSGSTIRGLVINRFADDGIRIDGGSNNVIAGNYIGTNLAGIAAAGNGDDAIDLRNAAANNTIGGTSAADRNILAGNPGEGIQIVGAGTSGNVILGNYIGLGADGSTRMANGSYGIVIGTSASANTVGGTAAGSANVISGNTLANVRIQNAATGNTVLGNSIGLNAAGTAAVVNGSLGISIQSGSNTIGGSVAGARNVISGNAGEGIHIESGVAANVIRGNYIGTDATGMVAIGNAADGILLENTGNTVGGAAAADRNVISGNAGSGVNLLLDGADTNTIQGNYIGVNANATGGLGNQQQGILFNIGPDGNSVSGNVIGFNTTGGIRIIGNGTDNTTNNVIQGNWIGTDSTGALNFGNGLEGIAVQQGATGNQIGGTGAGQGNVIAFNAAAGVAVYMNSPANPIRGNAIYGNGGLGIDLDTGFGTGVSANDGALTPGQSNLLMDFPVVQSAVLSGTTLTVSGYIGIAPNDTDFAGARVEFFKSPDAVGANGEGQVYLGFLIADANGNFSGALTVSGVAVGDRVSATATDPSGNTSEFGVNVTVAPPNTAPVLADTVVMLNAVNEDAGAPVGAVGTLVSGLVGGVSDADGGALQGIAIAAADAANGTWYYSTDNGTSWNALGVPSAASSRLLAGDANTRIYFQPNANYNGTLATAITFRAWDQTSGSNGGTANTSSNGGTTPFSSATDIASLTVNPVNDAPVLDNSGAMTLTGITEDDLANSGDLVATIIASAGGNRITDVDSGAVEGIAVTALVSGNGTWEYSTDGGGSWNGVGAVSNASALLLRASDRLRFVPDGLNADSPTVSFRAWDQTSGVQGTKVDVSTNGGSTAFSSAMETANLTVIAVNDAPVLADTVVTLNAVNEDAGAPVGAVGTLISALTAGLSDVDSAAVQGIAITAADATDGTWWYSTDNGGSWNALGVPSVAGARLLAADANTRIYFQPNADYNGTLATAMTFRAWDRSSGANGGVADTTINGGTTAFSTATDTASLTVNPVNDAPTITAIADQTIAEEGSTPALAFTIGDTETAAGALSVTATSSNTTLIPNANLVLGGAGANRTLTVSPAANAHGGPVTITVSVFDGTSTTQETFDVTVTPVADTPSVSNATTNEDTQTSSGLVISRNAADGVEVSHFKITGISGGTLYLNNGTTAINDGDFITFAQGNAGLKFTPSANSTASGSFDVQASTVSNDSGLGGGVVTATITVNPVNDEPSFTLGGNQTVNEDAGAQAVVGFAAALPGGGGDETAQTFTYGVSNNNNALFSAQPTIDASGTLTYTAAANAFGSATVTVFVTDSGGTANGGDDTSASQTFTITVNPVADAPTVVLPGAGLAYVEDQAGQVIDAAATVVDPEGNWPGGTLSVQVTANAETADRLTILSVGGVSVAVNGTDVLVGATIVGTTAEDTATGGNALTITFNAAATSADVQAVARAIGYYSSSQDPSTAARTVTFTAADAGALAGSATQTVNVTRINDAPSLTATASNPSYAAGAAVPVGVFSAASASTIEGGQTFSQLVLSVSNLADGAAERLRIDGTFVGLTNGSTATTAGNGYGVNVSVAGNTATVTLTITGASAAQVQALIDGLAYENISGAPAGGARTVTLTSLQDSGGTAGGGADTSSPAIASAVTVTTSGAIPVAADDAYSLTEEGSLSASGVSGWWNASWQYRRQIAIDNLGRGQLTDFPILIALNSSNIDYAQTQNQGQDLRFVDANGALLVHEIESWNESGTSYVWVKVPVVDANSSSDTITMYYGNAAAPDTQNADAVWNTSYVGVWHLNQTGSGAANEFRDSSGTGNHGRGGAGSAAETPAQGTGRIGTGQNFDGTNDFIEVQSTASLQLSTAMTLEGWVRMDSFGSADVVNALLRKGEGNPNNYQLSIGDQTPFFTLDDGENTGSVAPSTVNAGQWYHLSATFDGATRRLYVNGVQVDSDAYSGPIGTDLRDLYIGGRPGTDLSDGVIDEVRVSNTARSADWLTAQYANVTNGGYLTFGAQQSATGGGVLFNDSDADGEALTAVLVTPPANAAAFTLNADGSFTYTPSANFAGTDTFTYRANDGSNNSNVATVTITVNPINDEPSFTVPGNQTVNEDAGAQTVAGFAVAAAGGGADEASQTFAYTVSNNNNGLFSVQPGIDASGNLTYTPAANTFGSATVTVFVTDSGGTAGGGDNTSPSQTFTITVNPVADTPSVTNATTSEDTQTTSGLVISRNAADGAEATHFKITGITGGALYLNDGTSVVSNGDFLTFAQANAGLKFTPGPNSTANGSFQVQASIAGNDTGLGGGVITATITVNAVNDAPVVTAGAIAGYSENGTAVVVDNTVTVSDVDDIQIVGATVTISAGLTAGDVLGFVDTAGITGVYNAGTGVLTLTGTDTLAAYQAALRSVTYSSTSDDPTALSAGRTIAWQVTDANADGSGAQTSAVVTSSVSLSALADAPVGTAGATVGYTENAAAVAIDNSVTVSDADDTQIAGATVSIAAGLSAGDVLGFTNTASITGSYNAGTGVLTLSGTDTLAAYQAALRSVTYSSASDDPAAASASRTIAWQVTDANSDGTGAQNSAVVTSTVNLTALADAPIVTAGAVAAYTENGAAVVIDNTITVSDADDTQITGATVAIGAGLTAGDVLGFVNTGTITGSYNAGTGVLTLTGTDTLAAYQAALRSVTYSSTSDDPTAVNVNRTIVWQVTDGDSDSLGAQTSVAATSTVNIGAVNDDPVAVDNAAATDEDSVLNVAAPGVLAGDSDVDGGALTVSAVDGNAAAVGNPVALASGALLTLNADGSFSYDPNGAFEYLGAGESDTDTFTYEVADGNGGFANATVTVTVNGVNDAPTGVDAVVTIDEDATYIFVSSDFGFADADASDNLQGVRIVSLPLQGSLTLGGFAVSAGQLIAEADIANGELVFTPAAEANGAGYASFTFRANDGTVDAAAANTVTIDVTAVNDEPSFTQAGNQSVNEDAGAQTAAGFVAAAPGGGTDEAGQALTYNVSNDNNALFLVQPTIDAAGTLSYTLAADANGVANVSVFVSDNGGTANGGVDSSAAQVFTITVNAVNDAPTLAVGVNQSVAEDAGVQSVAAFASAAPGGGPDETGQVLSYVVSNDNNALFALQPGLDGAGNLTYTTAPDAFGTATVTVFVADGGGTANGGVDASAAQTFTITVTPVNDAPVLGANALTLNQGDSVVLAAANLSASDVDDPAAGLSFSVMNIISGRFEYVSIPGVAITTFSQGDVAGGLVRFVHDGSGNAPAYQVSVSDGALSDGPLAASIIFNPTPLVLVPPPLPVPVPNELPPEPPAPAQEEAPAEQPEGGALVRAVFSPGRIEAGAPEAQFNWLEGGGAPARRYQPVATLNTFVAGPHIDPTLQLLAAAPANLEYMPSVPVDWSVRPAFPDADETPQDRIDVLLEQVQVGGMALSVGVVWWASRISGLLGSLLASAPAWRHIDPLPVVGRDEDEDKKWYDPNDRDADANELAIANVLEGAHAAGDEQQA